MAYLKDGNIAIATKIFIVIENPPAAIYVILEKMIKQCSKKQVSKIRIFQIFSFFLINFKLF